MHCRRDTKDDGLRERVGSVIRESGDRHAYTERYYIICLH